MTMISHLGYIPRIVDSIKSPPLNSTKEITIVIPVKNNQAGIDRFLNFFFVTHSSLNYPKEIIIVDNNSTSKMKLGMTDYPVSVKLLSCSKIGPASARNLGVQCCRTDWVLFIDSDCIPTASLLSGYLPAQDGSLGYAGNVKSFRGGYISQYYEQQEILLPPEVNDSLNQPRPAYLVTANCLVWKPAFIKVGGFNETIKLAGGEDIDLGFKLLNLGTLAYAFESLAEHDFRNSLLDFRERFIRYGKGNKIISDIYNLDLRPKRFKSNKLTVLNFLLSYLQYRWMLKGYLKK